MKLSLLLLVLSLCVAPCTTGLAQDAPDPFESWQYGDRGRLEIGVGGGGITNDPFLRRGGVSWRVGIHLFELLAVDLRWLLMPGRGEGDLKDLTSYLTATNEVTPDISRVLFAFTPGILFTPLHVEDWGVGALDFSLFVGGGILRTEEDEELVMPTEEYAVQIHPAFSFGMNLRVKIADVVALSVMPQMIRHEEEVQRTDSDEMVVESKANLVFNAQISFLTPEF